MSTPAVTVVLDWTFSPSDYFEVPIRIDREDYCLEIGTGTVQASLSATVFDSDPTIKERIHGSIRDRMHGVQLLSHRPFELSKPRMSRVRPDGSRDIFIELEGGAITLTGGSVDVVVTDSTGRVIRDSKQERVEQRASLADLIEKHRDSDKVLRALLASYDASTRDPANELVHLYEIRESISAAYGGEAAARAALGISASQWSRLGTLCNNEPLRQGRHRGKAMGTLRDATEAELSEARGISRAMIEAHLKSKK